MKLLLQRISSNRDSTLGVLYMKTSSTYEIGKKGFKFLCFTLEDEYRETKVYGETRIPEGTYDICLKQDGGFNARYSSRFEKIHKGMLHLQDVPGFTDILVHCGNNDNHTAGCLLLGYRPALVQGGEFELYNSTQAYNAVYPSIANAIDEGGHVEIEIQNFDEGYKHMG